ncbi:MAG: lysophospholipid acyltransferase family protein [Polyangiaceae bacterium]
MRFVSREVEQRIDRLEIPWGPFGVDPYGVSKQHLAVAFSFAEPIYKHYFSVKALGVENVPPRGRGMLVGNHSGGIAIDGMMVVASMFFAKNPPRLAQGMVEKFMNRLPFASLFTLRAGQLTGLPEHAIRLLEDERLLMVFPEGAKGTAKLYRERYSLVRFGTGFMRLALRTRTPIIPFAFLGGGAAIPSIYNAVKLGRMFGAPYIPITPYGVPFPLPVRLEVEYGEPMVFSGTGAEADTVIEGYVEQVRARIGDMIERGRARRENFAEQTLSKLRDDIGGTRP